MTRFTRAAAAVGLVALLSVPARADDAAAAAIDKAVKALGGEEKLAKATAFSWSTKGTIAFMDTDNEVTTRSIIQGLDHTRQEFEGEFGGMPIKGVTVLAGDKGWRKFGDMGGAMDENALAGIKQGAYLNVVPVTVLPLKGKGFKVGTAAEEKVGDKPAVAVKATGPDSKDFTIYFDKETGLPVKVVAKVADFSGGEVTQEATFSDYKDFNGIKKATKIEVKRDGSKFLNATITDFKVLDKVDPKTFTEPE